MKIITSIENKGKDYICNRIDTAMYTFTAITQTIRIKGTRYMKITTRLLQVHCSVNNSTNSSQDYYKHNIYNKQDVVFHCM